MLFEKRVFLFIRFPKKIFCISLTTRIAVLLTLNIFLCEKKIATIFLISKYSYHFLILFFILSAVRCSHQSSYKKERKIVNFSLHSGREMIFFSFLFLDIVSFAYLFLSTENSIFFQYEPNPKWKVKKL